MSPNISRGSPEATLTTRSSRTLAQNAFALVPSIGVVLCTMDLRRGERGVFVRV